MSNIFGKMRCIFSLKVIAPVAILALAGMGAYTMVATAPKAKQLPRTPVRPLVEAERLAMGDYHVWVPAMGTVEAAKEITLESLVSGKVASVSPSFVPGGYFRKGETILAISPEDYELDVQEVQAEVTEAEYDLKVEQGYQTVASREWDLLKSANVSTDAEEELALRKPHLAKAKADLAAARAKLRQAKIDLARTHIKASFAAMVEEKSVDIGAAVSTQESLGTLVGTDEFWVTASVPVDRLGWINIPRTSKDEGALVRISSGSGANSSVRTGRVVRLLPALESEGRMARVVISVKDPLNLAGKPGVKPLLLGSYVAVEIDGGTLKDVFAVPRTAYHDNGKVWLLTENSTLDIRQLTPVWRDKETMVFEKGFATGDRLVTSDLSAPVQGMAVCTANASEVSQTQVEGDTGKDALDAREELNNG